MSLDGHRSLVKILKDNVAENVVVEFVGKCIAAFFARRYQNSLAIYFVWVFLVTEKNRDSLACFQLRQGDLSHRIVNLSHIGHPVSF